MNKIVEGLKEATQSTRCKHSWSRVSTRIEARMIIEQVDVCEKCGTRRTQTSTLPNGELHGD